ncbi:MAG: radical SAM protein [Candidatus Cloacimonetes bacterium]|nr:radical SAM protein [Candidatus Cloacimonadota bacterium]
MSFTNQNRDLAGILQEKVFEGPRHVVIDITNRCNTNCLACWTYSPMLKKENRPPKEWYKQSISWESLSNLIDDLADMGVQRIRFTGGGEPLLYKQMPEAIQKIKSRGIWLAITTNGTLLQNEILDTISSLKVDEIAISLWAASEKTYRILHPAARDGQFFSILRAVQKLKSNPVYSPRISFLNVINRHNVHEISKMGDLARNLCVDSVYYTLVDSMPDTRELVLSDSERIEAIQEVKRVKHRFYNKTESLHWDNLEGFEARLVQTRDEVIYDRDGIDKMPCYMGWHFARIGADGGVFPCCKGVDYPMGFIAAERFRDIWINQKYRQFRILSLKEKKDHPYFAKMNCYQMCDNLMHNEQIHQRLTDLRPEDKTTLLGSQIPVLQDLKG